MSIVAPVRSFLLARPKSAALLAGAASATGFAPLSWWPVTLLALALLIGLLSDSRRARAAFALGWWFGFGQFALSLNWIATAFTYQAAMPGWLGWVAVVLVALYLAIFPGLATLSAWWINRWTMRRAKPVAAPDDSPQTPEILKEAA